MDTWVIATRVQGFTFTIIAPSATYRQKSLKLGDMLCETPIWISHAKSSRGNISQFMIYTQIQRNALQRMRYKTNLILAGWKQKKEKYAKNAKQKMMSRLFDTLLSFLLKNMRRRKLGQLMTM